VAIPGGPSERCESSLIRDIALRSLLDQDLEGIVLPEAGQLPSGVVGVHAARLMIESLDEIE
jgi:hypothetical protein